MYFSTIIALLFCISAVSINGLETCKGPSTDAADDFKPKYEAAPIVVYGTVSDIKDKEVTLKVNCSLKDPLPVTSVEVQQFGEVQNLTDCHYLTVNKNYIVFLQAMKQPNPNSKNRYTLVDMEEIEVTPNSLENFLRDECDDEEDYGIEMTIFYADEKTQCGRLTATCNELTKTALRNRSYAQLPKTATFIAGYKKSLPVPKMRDDDNGTISGKHGGIGDEAGRGSATITTIWMPLIVFITGLTMLFNN